jgi:murein DD-endopeptidase MepM/ murein hydrolase activator NlpD
MYADFLEWAFDNKRSFYPILPYPFDAEHACHIDLSIDSLQLKAFDYKDPNHFQNFIDQKLWELNLKMAIGGYLERRNLYQEHALFVPEKPEDERSIHLGIDIWMPVGTSIASPLDAVVHSFNDNKGKGNYGPTIILKHQVSDKLSFFTLYGHLSREDLKTLERGKKIKKGEIFAHFGSIEENGNWAAHLHFQIILDMKGNYGDYPGVASDKMIEFEKNNCPDPNIVLNSPLI